MAKAASQNNHYHTHPEVLRIHVQLVTVQLAQLSKGALEVVEMFQAVTEGLEHLLAVGLHLGIAHDGIGIGQVPKGLEEPLSPGVDNQHPGYQPAQGLTTNFVHIHFAPQAEDGLLLLSRQMHHVVCLCSCYLLPSLLLGADWPRPGRGSTG
uniref:Uncharacterized protein n=3 Tax=Sus scrofa TaxID=9823 RepID=A0A4X1SZ34_PIG